MIWKKWMVLLLLLPGCAVEKLAPPVLHQVCLASQQATCVNGIYAGQAADVLLIGEHFSASFEVDIGSQEAARTPGQFSAWIDDIALTDVTPNPNLVSGLQALRARIPGTVDPGSHNVALRTPGGQRVTLKSAFLVIDPLQASAAAAVPRIPVGATTDLKVTLSNLGPVSLDGIAIALSQEGAGFCLLPPTPNPFELDANATSDVHLSLQAQRPGSMTVAISVSGLAGGEVPVETESSLLVPLEIQ